jgi:hypothetical protein
MLRFPYRRMGVKPLPALTPRPSWLVQLFGVLIGKPAPEERAPSSHSPSAVDDPPRRFVSVRIKGPTAARRLRSALLDTGSLDTLFPAELAAPLGILLGGERRSIRWRGQRHEVEFHTVELELAEGANVLRWRGRVGFTAAPLAYALLGQRGCLECFDAKFRGADQVVELESNRALPTPERTLEP